MNLRYIAAALCSILLLSTAQGAETITVDPAQTNQTIYGFGAGMKRNTVKLRSMATTPRTEILNLMFKDVDPRIYRTFLRHDQEAINDNADPDVLDLGGLDFSAGNYADDFWVHDQAMAIGGAKIDTFYASCNTAPAWMKDNTNTVQGTLLPQYYTEFAEFL